MRDLLINFSMKDEFAQVDSCIVAISSHGSLTASKELAINGCDDVDQSNPLLCNEVISYFNSDECKLRAGQPKVFIIQACRLVLIGKEKYLNLDCNIVRLIIVAHICFGRESDKFSFPRPYDSNARVDFGFAVDRYEPF